ncbi:MAG: tRNA-guanine transglycosylase, partial [Spirochaetia bacterium]
SEGPLSLINEKYRNDFRPIDETCECETCRNHSRAYLRHLFKAKEIQAAVLATFHNLTWLHRFVESTRRAISRDDFSRFKTESLERLGQTGETLTQGAL